MMSNENEKRPVRHDDNTGLSARAETFNRRSFKADGSFNVITKGIPWFRPYEVYHHLISMGWLKFNIIVLLTFIVANSFFALIYYWIGVEHLTAYAGHSEWEEFLHAFFFSAQSLTTVGYGRIAPVSISASWVAAFQSMIGLLIFALATGLLYGRFSRPNARIIYSKNILVAPYLKGTALMFRIANKRTSQLVDADVQVTLNKVDVAHGERKRMFYPLKLERHHINMLPLSWTVVHAINEESPLLGFSQEGWVRDDIEVLVYFKAYDETFSNHVHARISYKADVLVWGATFVLNFEESPNGPTIHYLNKINDYEKAELPAEGVPAPA